MLLREITKIAKVLSAYGKWERFDSDSVQQGWRRKKQDGSYEYRYQDSDPNKEPSKKKDQDAANSKEKALSDSTKFYISPQELFGKIIQTSPLGGSTGAFLVKTERDDGHIEKHVVKTYSKAGGLNQIKNELLANKLYENLGLEIPDTHLSSWKGQPALVTEFIDGLNYGKDDDKIQFSKGFIADAWLANWDSLGMEEDNVVVSNRFVYRIDNGGSLLFRAQGGLKGDKFGDDVPELQTLRNPDINPVTAEAFGELTPESIFIQIRKLGAYMKDETIRSLVESVYQGENEKDISEALTERLIKRKNFILSYGKELAIQLIQDNALKRKEKYYVGEPVLDSKLEEDDIEIIKGYTDRRYQQMNSYLRGEESILLGQKKSIKAECKKLTKALKKLPKYEGIVYRGTKLDFPSLFVLSTMKPGDLIYMKAFTSTSRSKEIAQDFNNKVLFKIKSLTGRDISALSSVKREQEVLLSPDSRYKITGIKMSGFNPEIELEEILPEESKDKLPVNFKKTRELTAEEMKIFLLRNPKLSPKQRERISRLSLLDLKKIFAAILSKGETKEEDSNFTEIFI